MKPRVFFARALRWCSRQVNPSVGSIGERRCPICGFEGNFLGFGLEFRPDVMCPECGSKGRHRLLKLLFERRSVLPEDCRMLHIAPEPSVETFLRPLCAEYLTADLRQPDVDLTLNVEAMEIEDGRFDAVLCVHVLEHVDDRRALGELFRILAPGGVALLAVPMTEGWNTTYEDPEITDPARRRLHFGEADHRRLYGRDFRDRVREAGFALEEFTAGGADCAVFSVFPGERIFLGNKPAQAHGT